MFLATTTNFYVVLCFTMSALFSIILLFQGDMRKQWQLLVLMSSSHLLQDKEQSVGDDKT